MINILTSLLKNIPPKIRSTVYVLSVFGMALSVLDLAALALLAFTLNSVMSGTSISFEILGRNYEVENYFALAFVAILIALKSLLQLWNTYKLTSTWGRLELDLGQRVISKKLFSPWGTKDELHSAEFIRIVDVGTSSTIYTFIAPAFLLPTQISTIIVVLTILFIAQPLTAAVTIAFVFVFGIAVHKLVTDKATFFGTENFEYSNKIVRQLSEVFGAQKELILRGKLEETIDIVRVGRTKLVNARFHQQYLSTVPRFLGEIAMVVGFLLVGTISFFIAGPKNATIAVALFAIGGFRLVPAVASIQASYSQMVATLPIAKNVSDRITALRTSPENLAVEFPLNSVPIPENWELNFTEVNFNYPGVTKNSLTNVNLALKSGQTIGIVGKSGAGKSTFLDLVLGLVNPTSGEIQISGNKLSTISEAWQRSIGYVPQEVVVFDGNVSQNIALTWGSNIDESKVEHVLQIVGLLDYFNQLESGFSSNLGALGNNLSGGQKQRIGIARALYINPKLLILDEATSSLDSVTESLVLSRIKESYKHLTLISVAHRLSTITDCDQIYLFDNGAINDFGTFQSLIKTSSLFREQVELGDIRGD